MIRAMGLTAIWRALRDDQPKVAGKETTLLYEIMRGQPPEQPGRLYKLNGNGEWQRSSRGVGFRKVRSGELRGRICQIDHRDR